jgi:phosphohistidine swiveling domain-containing protein
VTRYSAPGPGPWQLETAHYPRPLTRFISPVTRNAYKIGWAETTRRYGLLLDYFEAIPVNDFLYCQPVPVVGRPGMPLPPRLIFQLLTRVHPTMRRRMRQAGLALRGRIWREDLRRWDEVVKPETTRRHLELQRIDPEALSDEALTRHLCVCSENLQAMIVQHLVFTLPCSLPLGDFLAEAGEWTHRSPSALLPLLSGSSPISLGVAAAELEGLGAALREARMTLPSAAPTRATLDALCEAPDPVGARARAYLEMVGYRSLGYDVADRYAYELPETLLRAIQVAVGSPERRAASDAWLAKRTAEVRAEVPVAHRAEFDDLLAEARAVNRLRDERGVYSDCWAAGIARRAILATGRRLAEKGVLADAELAVDASCEELVALLRGRSGPGDDALKARAAWRKEKTVADAPKWLGAKPELPPAEWMPPAARRAARAFAAWLFTVIDDHEASPVLGKIAGLSASPGVYEGTARIARGPSDFGIVEPGDVLVTLATSPSFNVLLPLLGAVVTDRGGALSHAAIVAREYGIPCVVGTKEATKVLTSGMRVRVDGDAGEVTIVR